MRYVCVHCDHRWEAEGAEPPTRCPGCMRATGVKAAEEITESARGGSASQKRVLVALAVAMLVGGGAYAAFRASAPAEQGAAGDRPLDSAALKAALLAEQVDAGALIGMLEADKAVRAFAERVTAGANGPVARTEAVVEALRARAKASAFVSWSLGEPRPSVVRTARETLPFVQKDQGRAELYPLEVASLAVAALRAVEVPAMVAELVAVPGEKAPLDASGYLGYFVVALPSESGAARLHDPYGGRKLSGNEKHGLLSDTQVVGAALALRAIHEVAYAADPRSALQSSSHALRLASSLPSVRTARGVIVLNGKMVEQGLQEFSAASQLRADAPRLHNLASAKVMTGDLAGAEADLARALERAPDFAGAQATLAALHMLRGDEDSARAAFKKAEELAPDLSLVQWGIAEFALRAGDREGALARAERALAARPSFDAKVRYGVLLRQAGRFEPMRKTAHELLALSPEYRKGDVRELIQTLLGPTALDPIEPDPTADDLADLGGPDLQLKLGEGSKLLEPPQGLPPVEPGEPGEPVLMLGDRSKLGLGQDGKRLQLKLSEP